MEDSGGQLSFYTKILYYDDSRSHQFNTDPKMGIYVKDDKRLFILFVKTIESGVKYS